MAGTGICNLSHKENPKNLFAQRKECKKQLFRNISLVLDPGITRGKAGMKIYQETVTRI